MLCVFLPMMAAAQHRVPYIDIVYIPPSGACSPANALVQYSGDLYVCDPNTLNYRLLSGNGGGGGGGSATAIQNFNVSATAPTDQQFFVYVGADALWEPKTISYATPGSCGSGQFMTTIALGSQPQCAQVAYANLTGSVPTWNQNTTGTAAGLSGTPNIAVGTINGTTATLTGTLTDSAAGGINASAGPVNTATAYQIGGTTVLSTSNSLPGTCAAGQIWGNPSGGLATTVYGCYATNSWVALLPSMSGTPSLVCDSGTCGTLTLGTGSNDSKGWINLNMSVAPTGGAGLVTVQFSQTYPVTPGCVIEPSNAAAAALAVTVQPFVNFADQTAAQFVIRSNSSAVSTSTAYQWHYECHL